MELTRIELVRTGFVAFLGAHIQIEGEIRHTEYTPKKAKKPVRTDSIRVNSILKLDRAEKAAAEEQEADEELPFDEAAE